MRKFRINVHGLTGTWFCIQEKRWWGWKTIGGYVTTEEMAKEYIRVMKESEEV